MNETLQLLFSVPIVAADIPTIPKDDHEYLLNSSYAMPSGSMNMFERTEDTYILDSMKESNLRAWLQNQIDAYAVEVMATRSKLKITQSWCLRHQGVPEKVFSHSHPNSIISGAYYVQADEASANIRFVKENAFSGAIIRWETDDELLTHQPWNWTWYEIPSQTGRLVLFPSYLNHSVDSIAVNQNLRCVLSFNTWFEGSFGNADNLRELKF